jgi:NAD(P)-dependent dehydrogenase (short-subunit alcohol dehydrogenase family)
MWKPEETMSFPKIALVTGASSGFGQLTASSLADRGYRVFGTSRMAHSTPSNEIGMLRLDVRSDDSVRSCVEQLMGHVDRIDVLVNNAGQIHASVVEETSLEQAKDILETNFWGAVRVTNAVLPIMRRQRHGHIINVSSLAGLIGIPGQAFYSASKFALEGYSEALSMEVEPFDILVSLIEPGFFKTHLHREMQRGALRSDDYATVREALETTLAVAIEQGDDPHKVAEIIVRVAGTKSPRLRYRVGNDSVWIPRLRALLSHNLFRRGMRRRFNIDKPASTLSNRKDR